MTRDEFIENVTCWSDLIDFCNDEGYERPVEDIIDADLRDERINDDLYQYVRENDWTETLNWLRRNEDQNGYDWYRIEYGEYVGLDDDEFENYKADVFEDVDRDNGWDDEDDEEEVSEAPKGTVVLENSAASGDDFEIADEGFSLEGLFAGCRADSDAALKAYRQTCIAGAL